MRFGLAWLVLVSLGAPAIGAPGARTAAEPASHPDWPVFEPLWPKGAPAAMGKADGDVPAMMTFLAPASAPKTGAAVVVFPGGGYWALAMDHEGVQIARFLNGLGVSAFVVRYRHGPLYHHPAPLLDAQRAIRLVRSRAEKLGLVGDRIGVWGFSAGGHLAATASTRFDGGNARASDPVDRLGSRPDFAILAYPVISFVAPWSHMGSAEGLLGKDGDARLLEELSADKRVTAWTPPTFLFHTNADTGVPPENAVAYYLALRASHVPAELHVYEKGQHGVGLAPTDPILSTWSARLGDWMKTRGLLETPAPCQIAIKGDSPVARACRSAGAPAAKVKMREMVTAAKAHGGGFACENCHGKQGLLPGADKKFVELLRLSGMR